MRYVHKNPFLYILGGGILGGFGGGALFAGYKTKQIFSERHQNKPYGVMGEILAETRK